MHQDADGNWVADLDPPVDGAPPPSSTPDPALPPPPPADPTAAGFALPSGAAPATTPGTAPRRSRQRGLRGIAAVVGVAVVVILVKVLIFSGAARVIDIATTKTYHEPTTIAGDAKSSDPSVVSTVTQLKDGSQLPALQGGHTEGAGYTDTAGDLDYLFVLAQDNANSNSRRPGVNLPSMFGGTGTTLSSISSSSFNGLQLECATVTSSDETSSGAYNACDWFNSDAFGLIVDAKSASLAATSQLATSLLNTMVK
jgi:hypothetical protein